MLPPRFDVYEAKSRAVREILGRGQAGQRPRQARRVLVVEPGTELALLNPHPIGRLWERQKNWDIPQGTGVQRSKRNSGTNYSFHLSAAWYTSTPRAKEGSAP